MMNARMRLSVLVAAGCLASVLACASSSSGSIPIEQLGDSQEVLSDEYTIGVGDLLSIQVFNQDNMSGRMRVRSDGRISLPLMNDIEASGKPPARLATELEGALKAVVLNPKVTVIVEESSPLSISVLGEVRSPGLHQLRRGASLTELLASSGGLTNFAHKDRIFVVRSAPKPIRIRFTYDQLTKAVGPASSFALRPGDIVVVE